MLAHQLPYGMRDGVLTHISDVPNGLACGCACAACGRPLVAKKGRVRQHHFAHANGSECQYGLETALHLAAKEILEARKEIFLPDVVVDFYSTRASFTLVPAKTYHFDEVLLERRTGRIVPDVIAYVKGIPLLIEVQVTHEVDGQKAAEIRKMGLSTIEIDLSAAPRDLRREDIASMIVGDGAPKKWIYNVESEQAKEKILSKATVHRAVQRNLARHIDGCPLSARVWNGRPYANVLHDCLGCERLLRLEKNMRVITCGESGLGVLV